MSGLLDSLPTLPDITGRSAYAPTSSGTSGSDIVSKTAAAVLTGGATIGTKMTIQSIVFVLLGLLFIAGGIFAFREVREAVVTTTKTAAKAAAAA